MREEQGTRVVWSRKMDRFAQLSINIPEFLGMVINAYVIGIMRGDRPEHEGSLGKSGRGMHLGGERRIYL